MRIQGAAVWEQPAPAAVWWDHSDSGQLRVRSRHTNTWTHQSQDKTTHCNNSVKSHKIVDTNVRLKNISVKNISLESISVKIISVNQWKVFHYVSNVSHVSVIVDSSTMSAPSVILYGDNTRELYTAWHARVGSTNTISQNLIQPLFNDMGLYPSTSQASGHNVWNFWISASSPPQYIRLKKVLGLRLW